MLVCEGSVTTLWAWVLMNTRPCPARRSSTGVSDRRLPPTPAASRRTVAFPPLGTLIAPALFSHPLRPTGRREGKQDVASEREGGKSRSGNAAGTLLISPVKPPSSPGRGEEVGEEGRGDEGLGRGKA